MPRKKATPPEEASAAVVDNAEALELEERNKELQDVAENVEVTEPGETVEESYSDSDNYELNEPIAVVHLDGKSPSEYDSPNLNDEFDEDDNFVVEEKYETNTFDESVEENESDNNNDAELFNTQSDSVKPTSRSLSADSNKRQAYQINEKQRFIGTQAYLREQIQQLRSQKNGSKILIGTVVKAFNLNSARNKTLASILSSLGLDTVFAKISVNGYDDDNFEFLIPFSFLDAQISGLSEQLKNYKSHDEREKQSKIITRNNEISTIPFENKYSNEKFKVEYINSIMNSKIAFTIDTILPRTTVVIANRKLANFFRRRTYYYRGKKSNRLVDDKKRYVDVGTVTDAKIVAVYTNKILIDIFGAQCIIPLGEITHKRTGTLKNIFKPGMSIRVKVTSLTRLDNEAKDVDIHASVIATSKYDKTRDALDMASEGEIVLAEITSLDTFGNPSGLTKTGYNFQTDNYRIKSLKKRCSVGSIIKVSLKRKIYPAMTRINPNPSCYGLVTVLDVMESYDSNHFLG